MELKTAGCVSGDGRHSSGDDMKCYSEKDGSKFQLCQKRLGYRTCFVQYGKGSCLILIENTISNSLVNYVLNMIIFRPQKKKTLYAILYTMTWFQSAFRRRNCPERLLHKKVWYCSSTEFIIKITILFSARCSTWSVKITSVVLKVKNFAIAAIICAIIRKRLAKVSRSCSGWASLLPPWPRDAAELISWHVYCSVLVLSSLGAKYNKFAVIHAWRNAIDLIPETIWY